MKRLAVFAGMLWMCCGCQTARQESFGEVLGDRTLVVRLADGTEWTSRARGIKPLLDALDAAPERFKGAQCYDRIVGRAAAFLYVRLGVREVCAPIASEGAVALLARNGIAVRAERRVPFIRNRANDGMCPMDSAVSSIDDKDVEPAIAALRAQLARLARAP